MRVLGVRFIHGAQTEKLHGWAPKTTLGCAKRASTLFGFDGKQAEGSESRWISLYGDRSNTGIALESDIGSPTNSPTRKNTNQWFLIESDAELQKYIMTAGRRTLYADILVCVSAFAAGALNLPPNEATHQSPLRILLGGHPHDVVEALLNSVAIEITGGKSLPISALDNPETNGLRVTVDKVNGLKGVAQCTKYVEQSRDPVWNETLEAQFDHQLSCFEFQVQQQGNETPIGRAKLPIDRLLRQLSSLNAEERIGKEVTLDVDLPLQEAQGGQLHIVMKATYHIPFVCPMERIALPAKFQIGLAWDFSAQDDTVDLDESIVGLDAEENIVEQVWFNNTVGFGGAVRHTGDNRSGDGSGDDEVINIDTSRIPITVEKLAVCINSYGGQSLSKVNSAYLRIIANGRTKAVTWLSPGRVPNATGVLAAVICRSGNSEVDGEWQFIPTWAGANGRTVEDSRSAIIKFGKDKLGW